MEPDPGGGGRPCQQGGQQAEPRGESFVEREKGPHRNAPQQQSRHDHPPSIPGWPESDPGGVADERSHQRPQRDLCGARTDHPQAGQQSPRQRPVADSHQPLAAHSPHRQRHAGRSEQQHLREPPGQAAGQAEIAAGAQHLNGSGKPVASGMTEQVKQGLIDTDHKRRADRRDERGGDQNGVSQSCRQQGCQRRLPLGKRPLCIAGRAARSGRLGGWLPCWQPCGRGSWSGGGTLPESERREPSGEALGGGWHRHENGSGSIQEKAGTVGPGQIEAASCQPETDLLYVSVRPNGRGRFTAGRRHRPTRIGGRFGRCVILITSGATAANGTLSGANRGPGGRLICPFPPRAVRSRQPRWNPENIFYGLYPPPPSLCF